MRRPAVDAAVVLPVISGLLLAASFPRPSVASFAWVALVPLLLVAQRHPFRTGFLAGTAFFAAVLYWLNIVMTTYGRMHPVFSGVAYLLLVGYLALFFGAATWVSCRLREHLGTPVFISLPIVWVGLEFLRSFLFTGFPWATLGYSQHEHLFLIQSADLFGVYGVSFLLLLSNALLAEVVRGVMRRSVTSIPWRAVVVGTLLIAANGAYGVWRLSHLPPLDGKFLEVALAQGNIDQSLKWNPAYQRKTVEIYRDLSLASAGADLVVWPESATPFYFQDDNPLARQVRETARQSGAHLLFGSPAYEVSNRRYSYLNSAFLLSPEGDVLGRSDKVHLVPFGEYVPLGRFLPFIDKMVAGIGDFSPGTVSPLPMNGASVGVLVCFEGIFPELARDYVQRGSALLVNITNDAWFGRSSAPYQHLAMTRFRAVENRIWVVRAANTGISAFIDPSGRVISQTPLFETAHLSGRAQLGAGGAWYTRTGDILPVLCLLLSVWWLVLTRRRYNRS